jgi:hypothetical protein
MEADDRDAIRRLQTERETRRAQRAPMTADQTAEREMERRALEDAMIRAGIDPPGARLQIESKTGRPLP